jgi:hypothetical protein
MNSMSVSKESSLRTFTIPQISSAFGVGQVWTSFTQKYLGNLDISRKHHDLIQYGDCVLALGGEDSSHSKTMANYASTLTNEQTHT